MKSSDNLLAASRRECIRWSEFLRREVCEKAPLKIVWYAEAIGWQASTCIPSRGMRWPAFPSLGNVLTSVVRRTFKEQAVE